MHTEMELVPDSSEEEGEETFAGSSQFGDFRAHENGGWMCLWSTDEGKGGLPKDAQQCPINDHL